MGSYRDRRKPMLSLHERREIIEFVSKARTWRRCNPQLSMEAQPFLRNEDKVAGGSPVVRTLLNIRFFAGRLFGWDHEPTSTAWETFTTRLTTADRSRLLAPAGTREGLFRIVYRFENEQLLELINRTAHAAALSALVETANGYRFYFGVYVQNVGRFTPVYMTRSEN
jgi:hypothetical protein